MTTGTLIAPDAGHATAGADGRQQLAVCHNAVRRHQSRDAVVRAENINSNDVGPLTAYVLDINNMVGNNFVADRNAMPKVSTPSYDHFKWQDPPPDTSTKECVKGSVDPNKKKIKSTADGTLLTPRTTGSLE